VSSLFEVGAYLQIVEGSYIWRNIPSYEESISKSVVKMPKGNIRDSGLQMQMQMGSEYQEIVKQKILTVFRRNSPIAARAVFLKIF
jgi:predicted AAA+ superfamily ATPase